MGFLRDPIAPHRKRWGIHGRDKMTAPLYDLIVAPVAADLLACLTVEMGKTPVPPDQICMRVGSSVALLLSTTYDECCAGLAWVRFARQYPSKDFPEMDEGTSPCTASRWALVFELGVARCGPVAGDAESIPSCDDWTAVAVTQFADLAALRRTACCYAKGHRRDRKVAISDAVPQSVEGGCNSLTMQVTISALACDPGCRESD